MATRHAPAPDLLTVEEVATLLRVSKRTVQRLTTERHEIDFNRVGGRVLVDRTAVEDYLSRTRIRATPNRPRRAA